MEIFGNKPERNKEEEWAHLAQKIERIVDGLGEHLDEGIKESVIALKANGIGTTGSCEGHLDRALPYPWIDVGSTLAEEHNVIGSRFYLLRKKYQRGMQGGEIMSEEDMNELQELTDIQTEANEAALIRLSNLLSEFNETKEDNDINLAITKRIWKLGRLQPEDVPTGSSKMIKEQLSVISEEELELNLKKYREEMNRFAQFLKKCFFK